MISFMAFYVNFNRKPFFLANHLHFFKKLKNHGAECFLSLNIVAAKIYYLQKSGARLLLLDMVLRIPFGFLITMAIDCIVQHLCIALE